MVVLAGIASDHVAARTLLEEKLAAGDGLATFRRWVELQGGDPAVVDDPSRLPAAPVVREVPAERDGVVAEFDSREIGFAANALGAGRSRVGDPVDPAVGFVLRAKLGDRVEAGQPLAHVHARTEDAAEAAARRLRAATRLADEAPAPRPLVLEPARAG